MAEEHSSWAVVQVQRRLGIPSVMYTAGRTVWRVKKVRCFVGFGIIGSHHSESLSSGIKEFSLR